MHRFYLPPAQCRGNTLVLDESETHHALHVLRVKTGERVVVLDGAGHEFLCEVRGTERKGMELAVRQTNPLGPMSWAVTLIQAVTKAKSMDLIVQKATELGAARVVPILSDRSVPNLDGEGGEKKVDKWQAIAIDAIKQCGSPWLPRIDAPQTASAFLAQGERYDLSMIASLQPGSRHPREYLDSFVSEHKRRPRSLAIWVGPEGDFTPAELNAVKGAGAAPISLGPLVLLSETAAIYCLSVLGYESQWNGK